MKYNGIARQCIQDGVFELERQFMFSENLLNVVLLAPTCEMINLGFFTDCDNVVMDITCYSNLKVV